MTILDLCGLCKRNRYPGHVLNGAGSHDTAGDMNGEKALRARFPATNEGVKPMTHPPINGRNPSR
jgi:hypothetical protein